jgi:hypothetical protein
LKTANKGFKGSFTGVSIGSVTQAQKIYRSLQAFGDIAFAYSYSIILIEIQVIAFSVFYLQRKAKLRKKYKLKYT